LRVWQAVQAVQERSAELVQSGVGQLHLGLSTGQPRNAATAGARFEVVEQRRLAYAGLAS
jgi:hypothetical protein